MAIIHLLTPPTRAETLKMSEEIRVGATKGSKDFRSIKKFTSLDNTIVIENLFIPHNSNPYTFEGFSLKNNLLCINYFAMKYLPDNLNFVKVFGYILDSSKKKPLAKFQCFEDMKSMLYEPEFMSCWKVGKIKPAKGDVYLFMIYGTFEDIFNVDDDSEDLDFNSLIFGFSLVKLMKPNIYDPKVGVQGLE